MPSPHLNWVKSRITFCNITDTPRNGQTVVPPWTGLDTTNNLIKGTALVILTDPSFTIYIS